MAADFIPHLNHSLVFWRGIEQHVLCVDCHCTLWSSGDRRREEWLVEKEGKEMGRWR